MSAFLLPLNKRTDSEYAYLFGSVCPRKGIYEAIVVLWVNKGITISLLRITKTKCVGLGIALGNAPTESTRCVHEDR